MTKVIRVDNGYTVVGDGAIPLVALENAIDLVKQGELYNLNQFMNQWVLDSRLSHSIVELMLMSYQEGQK